MQTPPTLSLQPRIIKTFTTIDFHPLCEVKLWECNLVYYKEIIISADIWHVVFSRKCSFQSLLPWQQQRGWPAALSRRVSLKIRRPPEEAHKAARCPVLPTYLISSPLCADLLTHPAGPSVSNTNSTHPAEKAHDGLRLADKLVKVEASSCERSSVRTYTARLLHVCHSADPPVRVDLRGKQRSSYSRLKLPATAASCTQVGPVRRHLSKWLCAQGAELHRKLWPSYSSAGNTS